MKRLHVAVSALIIMAMVSGCGWFGGQNNGGGQQGRGGQQARTGGEGWGKPEKPQFKIPVTAEVIERERMFAYLQAVGTVVPTKEVELKPEMTGRIYYTKRWMEGDEIKKGEVLATIDDRQLRLDINEAELQLELAKAAVRPAKAQLDQAIKDAEFKKIMHERGAISKAEYDLAELTRIQRENQYEEAQRNVDSRQMALERLKQELEKVEITAPFDGVLLPSDQMVTTGSTGNEGSATDLTLLNGQTVGSSAILCRLAVIDQVYVSLDVPAKDLADVSVGQEVELEIYSRTGNEFTGKVAEISTALNANTRTYTVKVMVDNTGHQLRPGMFAKARIITDERLDAISIPRSMVQLRNNQHIVFVAKPKENEQAQPQEGGGQLETEPVAQGGEGNQSGQDGRRNRQLAMAGENDGVAFAADDKDPSSEGGKPDYALENQAENDDPVLMVAEERVVQRGIENREEVEIVSGLKEGELLVVLGYETLTDGVDISVTVREDGILANSSGTAQNPLQ